MAAEYKFHVGQRVGYAYECKFGEVVSVVPGNGRLESEWYFVKWDDGTEDRYMRDSLYAI